MAPKPAAEIAIDVQLVGALLAEQMPALASAPLSLLAEGWDNVLFRLGDSLTVRLPRREASAALLEHEHRWLPVLAPGLPLPVPVPLHAGRPSPALRYPWSWSVARFLPGTTWDRTPPRSLPDAARDLGHFIAALHRPAPADAPRNPFRGIALAARDELLTSGLQRLGASVDADAIRVRWRRLLTTPGWAGPPQWLHGDLHPLNLLVDGGRLSAVIDFGDVCVGDPASDFAVAWMLLPPETRPILRDAAGIDEATWRRGQAWALALGVAFAGGDERIAHIGRHTLDAVLAHEA